MGRIRSWTILLLLATLLAATGCARGESPGTEEGSKAETPADVAMEEPGVNGEPEVAEPSEEELQAAREAERAALEEERKAKYKEFYVPLPPLDEEREPKTVKAKGLYMTSHVAGFAFDEADVEYYAEYVRAVTGQSGKAPDASRLDDVNKLEQILGICLGSEVNALVIDVKNDDGFISWASDIQVVNEVKSTGTMPFKNHAPLMEYLKKNDIYTIARVVAFKDPYFAAARSSHAIQLKAGGVYKDKSGVVWVNPFDPYVWDYNVAVSREAALRGFDEIQFDYVRFPESAKYYNPITDFPHRDGRDKDEGIEDFLAYARKELEPYKVHIAADVFGVATRSWDDTPEDIGQTWRKIANQVEYICPMIYPSHYGANWYGYAVPDQHPYGVLRAALMEALERNAAQKDPAVIRPWIQGFTAPWIKGYINYDPKAISDQIVAGMELGVDEYIIWSPRNNYDPRIFTYHSRIDKNIRKEGEDILARTPEAALKQFLEAERHKRYSQQYLLTPLGKREEDYDLFAKGIADSQLVLTSHAIRSVQADGAGGYVGIVDGEYTSVQGKAPLQGAAYKIALEKDVYKVTRPALQWTAVQGQ
ncbi:putative glycoside hydrolase [Anaerotalea alkaliphila]|uniref:DUF4015 domain-containing protein n=1 Tax=Anaerotalea alkaliphila TaxID=2662126 RepID=A0A7X5KL96_9FIRM|nr:putative glycoside hydrolase [Anaerotalea alkaliphila]NDL66601.1 hypothetical protein [Anaerotalea alkaliphila]